MSTELIVNASLPETRIALMESGEIQELLIERASEKGIVGNIYKGRVTRVLPGMQAAFVDIGLEKAAFLYVDDVFVHSEIWEEEEGESEASAENADAATEASATGEPTADALVDSAASAEGAVGTAESTPSPEKSAEKFEDESAWVEGDEDDEDEDDEDEGHGPVEMSAGPEGGDDGDNDSAGNREQPVGTIAPAEPVSTSTGGGIVIIPAAAGAAAAGAGPEAGGGRGGPKRHRRGRRGGRFRRRPGQEQDEQLATGAEGDSGTGTSENYPESFNKEVADRGMSESDRTNIDSAAAAIQPVEGAEDQGRPITPMSGTEGGPDRRPVVNRPEFRAQRGRDRRIRPKASARNVRTQANIQDLLKEGQEVLVQVAKDPIATKGARLTCHISLPGRHLVCMPTIDHVGVSRRIDRDEERRRLREYVERNRPKNLGFIVRTATASGKVQSERKIKQDVDYLSNLWNEIREKAAVVTAPALVYEDLNVVLRAIRDWVTEDIDKIIVDSRYHFNEMQKFVSNFMPALRQKVELYHGDIPIFDAYGISTELSRALERKVWLKSGGYIVVDQAEALVAIDVNTGRYVGKKNLEDTILKTNLEAVEEIAYQLRLRNCGGIIILDLIDMEKEENKHRVYRALEEAIKKDRARPSILKISELGLVEMTRKRTRDTMVRALCDSCTHCEGKGFIKSKQTVAYEVLREIERTGIERDMGKVLIQAHPEVIDILAIEERETLDQLERRYRKQIYLQAAADFHPEQFEVAGDKKPGKDTAVEDERSRWKQRGRGHSSNESRRPPRQDRSENSDRQDGPPRPLVIIPVSPGTIVPVTATAGDPPMGEIGNGPGNGVDTSSVSVALPRMPADGFDNEEDRLAYLRAQAAQDAAIARMTVGGAGPTAGKPRHNDDKRPHGRGPGGPGGRGGRGGRGGGGRSGGGRFQGRGPQTPRPYAGTGPRPVITAVDAVKPAAAEAAPASSSDAGGNGGTGGSNGGSGGDNSQPPV